MHPLCLTKEDLGDQKFKFTVSDKHQSAHKAEEESAAFELFIDKGELKEIDVSHDGVKKMRLHFFFGDMGRVMRYELLDENLELSEQLRMGTVQYLQPGLHYLGRIVTDYLYPRVFHRYADGATMDMFYNPFDPKYPLSFYRGNSEDPTRTQGTRRTFFAFDKEKGLIERQSSLGSSIVINTMDKRKQNPTEQKTDMLKMQKMAVLAELDKLTPIQQKDVLAVMRAKIASYQK